MILPFLSRFPSCLVILGSHPPSPRGGAIAVPRAFLRSAEIAACALPFANSASYPGRLCPRPEDGASEKGGKTSTKEEANATASQSVTPEMLALLARLREKCAIGFVGGSNLAKQQEQLGTPSVDVVTLFDWCFAENGLTAYRVGEPLESNSFIKYIGEENYKELVNFCLRYIADLDIPVKRGTFVEFRNGMINVSPIGRNASVEERDQYQKFDLEHKIREKFVEVLKEKFGHLGLTYVATPCLFPVSESSR